MKNNSEFFNETYKQIGNVDSELLVYIKSEHQRQSENIELIASENFVSPGVLSAAGTVLTNKYAEGYSGKRYYGGCEYIDKVETLAINRAKELFKAEHVNVQPHCGTSANIAAYNAFLKPDDIVLAMDLNHGGHLSHGSSVSISGEIYQFEHYGVNPETEQIDYENVLQLAKEYNPKMILAGCSNYSRKIDFSKFREIADEVGAYLMVDMAHIAGLVATGLHQSPISYADVVTTTTHKTLRGPRGGMIFCKEKYAKQVDFSVFPSTQGGPLMHIIAAKALALKESLSPEFITYQKQVIKNAKTLADELNSYGYDIVGKTTDNHLLTINLTHTNITGRDLEKYLDECKITANKNTIPFDTQSPFVTSGLRIGTPAVTTRGFKEEEMKIIANCIHLIITDFESNKDHVLKNVKDLTKKFPLY